MCLIHTTVYQACGHFTNSTHPCATALASGGGGTCPALSTDANTGCEQRAELCVGCRRGWPWDQERRGKKTWARLWRQAGARWI
jgi:hypothetical protein